MRTILSYYMFEDIARPIFLIVDDNLADEIRSYKRDTSLATQNVSNIAEAQNFFATYFGTEDILVSAYPVNKSNYTESDPLATDIRTLLGNSFIMPSVAYGGNSYVNNVELSASGANVSPRDADVNKYIVSGVRGVTPYTLETICSVSSVSIGQYYYIEFRFLVLKESEVANGKINMPELNACTVVACRYSKTRASISTIAPTTADKTALQVLNNIDIPVPPAPIVDPYEAGGGASGTGGGTGTFSETGDIVGIPGLPTLSAVDTGFITLFNPTAAQVKQLAAYMWSNSFDMATFKNIVANPIDCILGLTIVPVNPPDAGTKAVSVGNIATDVNMPYLSSQYVEVDCGTLNVQEFWGSYLDYSPYTKMSLYLPYIGIVPLDIDDVMNATITIKYHVDVLSGACVAYVLCNGTQLYTYIGQCSSNVPITSNDFTNTVNGILGIAGSIGSLVATGGASAPTEIGKIAGNAINALKPNIQKSGAMSGTGGLMGVQTPYLICQRPRQSVPSSQNTFTGYPANITATLSDLSGYTEVDKIHLEGVPCTNEEMDEIMTLLESGVYI